MEKFYRIPLPHLDPISNKPKFSMDSMTLQKAKELKKVLKNVEFDEGLVSHRSLIKSRSTQNINSKKSIDGGTEIGWLFLSDKDSVQNDYTLKINKITSIIGVMKFASKQDMVKNIGKKLKKRFKENKIPSKFNTDVDFLKVEVDDLDTEDISRYFVRGVKFLDGMLSNSRNIAVFCNKALSRSPTMIIAFLIWKYKMTFLDSFNLLKNYRGKLRINKSFEIQLIEWEYFCRMKFNLH